MIKIIQWIKLNMFEVPWIFITVPLLLTLLFSPFLIFKIFPLNQTPSVPNIFDNMIY